MASSASLSEFISTKPKPLERPESRSMMTWAELMAPKGANISSSWLLSTE